LLIPGTPFMADIPNASPREAATDRITIRLRPGDARPSRPVRPSGG
jgi:hypothetical protein